MFVCGSKAFRDSVWCIRCLFARKWFSPHKLPYWRQEADYWVQNSYQDATSKTRFNSCSDPSLKIADVCSGRGSCMPFGDTGISFCHCNPGYGGAECQSKRLSQLTAWLLCLFFGPFGADQYYLGWYPEMLVTQILSVMGVLLLVANPSSKLPGQFFRLGWMCHGLPSDHVNRMLKSFCTFLSFFGNVICLQTCAPSPPGLVVLLGPWMRHVVIIGSAPAQAMKDRTSADLPRCAFVAFSILQHGAQDVTSWLHSYQRSSRNRL